MLNPGLTCRCALLLLFWITPGFFATIFSQTATLTGTVKDSTGRPVEFAYVAFSGKNGQFGSAPVHADGSYLLRIPAGVPLFIRASSVTYETDTIFLTAKEDETLQRNFVLAKIIGTVVEIVDRHKPEYIAPTDFKRRVGPNTDISGILRFAGAQSSNEFSNQYSVRGGNFDENLVYVNGIEVYRPFLTRAGQQEGLSFVNVDMTDQIHFYAGGFEAKYGDKMSSVLDIRYRRPDSHGGVFSASLLGLSAEVEGRSNNNRTFWMLGIRNKSNRYLLSSLDTRGDYRANFTDVQGYLTYDWTDRLNVEYLGNYAVNKYTLTPSTRETQFGTLNNALKFTVYFDGREINGYNTFFNAVSFNYRSPKKWYSRFIISSFNTYESETFDVQGQYYIDQLEADFGKPTFGDVAFNRGVGTFLNHARNYLDAWVNTAEVKTEYNDSNIRYLFGVRYQNERITDELSEWNYVDSAGYSVPYMPYNSLDLQDVVKSRAQLFSNRLMGYAQISYSKKLRDTSDLEASVGVRANYWDLNGQLIVSPRLEITWKPNWDSADVVFRLAAGLYSQPPFYRELRDFAGNLNRSIHAQTSLHIITGSDLNFKLWDRPFRFISEVYYKYLDNIIPYEVNDVRIRYFGDNLARGYAYGLDLRLNGKFVSGLDSWLNVSLLRTRENLYNDNYYLYLNSEGDTIVPGFTFNNIATDSILQSPGFIPRPTDQLVTVAIFFQDYLPNNEDFKMSLGLIFGSGLPFGPPSHLRHQAIFRMPPYRRVDIGFSYDIIKEGKKKKKKMLKPTSPLRFVRSLWVGVEVYNLLQVQNTVSYYWIKDVTGRTYGVPNYLTNRQLSVRMMMEF